MACGASKSGSGSSEFASRSEVNMTSTTKALAACSQSIDATSQVQAITGAVSNDGQKVDPNYINVKIQNLPASFTNGSYISLWKWYAEPSGFTFISSSPISYKLIHIETGAELTGFVTSLSWSNLAKIATALNATTPNELFKKVKLYAYINDPTFQFDAITVGFHNPTTGIANERVDALIPVFAADPRIYAVDGTGTRDMRLQKLHPFYYTDYSTWSVNSFQQMANELCVPLSQF
jgi:hypothetical protein